MNQPVKLADIVDIELLDSMIASGYIRIGRHNNGRYTLCDYTPAAQYSSTWNAATKLCRGLLLDGEPTGDGTTVLARPFGKFANLAEHGPDSPFGPLPHDGRHFNVTDKLDGSLAIAYRDLDGNVAFATRGSFHSDQANAATEWWHTNHGDIELDNTVTHLFEYIAPWNRIVVNYHGREQLVALAVIDIATGADRGLSNLHPDIARAEEFRDFAGLDEIADHARNPDADGTEREGFVICFDSNDINTPSLRVKVKYDTYVELHRYATNLTPRRIWEHLCNGGTVDELAALLPDEFHPDLRAVAEELDTAAQTVIADAHRVHRAASEAAVDGDRGSYARAAFQAAGDNRTAAHVAFSILDGTDDHTIYLNVLAGLRPDHDPARQIRAYTPPPVTANS